MRLRNFTTPIKYKMIIFPFHGFKIIFGLHPEWKRFMISSTDRYNTTLKGKRRKITPFTL